jgi:hypothetical protein
MGDADEFRPHAERNDCLPVLEPVRANGAEARHPEALQVAWPTIGIRPSLGVVTRLPAGTAARSAGKGPKKLWLVDDAPRCVKCCWSLGVRYRSAYAFG